MTPKEVYEQLEITRKPYEDRAKLLSELILPFLFLDEGTTASSRMEDSYSSRYASIAVTGLANNMSLTLLPPTGSSFRFDPDSRSMEEFTQGDSAMRAEIMAALGANMIRINKEIESQDIRPQFYEALLNLITVSPVVIEKVEGEGIKWHNLRNFCVKLDSMGEAIQLVIKETMHKSKLPDDVNIDDEESEFATLYTLCELEDEGWKVTQSIDDKIVGKESKYKYDELPYVYIGWIRQKGDTYHRPYAEQFKGILEDYASINKILIEGGLVASKSLVLVNPLGTTRKDDVVNSKNGDVIDGRVDDVTSFQLNKNYDFQIPMQLRQELTMQIDRAFLNRQGTQRDAERVTAEEIRANAQELEKNLSGIYSVMAKKFNKWLVKHIMKELGIKFENIDVNIITGLDALGRNMESIRMDNFMMRIANLGLNRWLKEDEIITRYASYEGIDITNLVKTQQEIQAEAQAQQEAMLEQQLLGSSAESLGKTAGSKAMA